MHEMALCRNVADIVLEEASRANAVRVSGIYLTIGYGRDIVEDLFETMPVSYTHLTLPTNREV